MTQCAWQWRMGGLRPGDAAASDLAAKLKEGQYVRAEVRRIRSPRQLRLWWALMGLIHEHQDSYATREDLSDAFKIWLGHCDEIRLKDGRTAVRPKSIALGNMGQDDFNEFFDGALRIVTERIIPGTTDAELRRELEALIGARSAA